MTKKLKYDFEIRRKITFIRGNSGTGKTTLYNLLRLHERGERVTVECSVPCITLGDRNWQYDLTETTNSIFFIDEDAYFLKRVEFAALAKKSNNYFVIISRFDFDSLPYSVNEIYEVRQSNRFHVLQPVFEKDTGGFRPSIAIVEDSKSGFQFYCKNSVDCKVISANGKANIVNALETLLYGKNGECVLIVVDGASFGSNLNGVMRFIEKNKANRFQIFAPESFEYLLLDSPMFQSIITDRSIIDNPENHVENHFSWEMYFSEKLQNITAKLPCKYDKSKLNSCFSDKCCHKQTKCDAFIGAESKQLAIMDKHGSHIELFAD